MPPAGIKIDAGGKKVYAENNDAYFVKGRPCRTTKVIQKPLCCVTIQQ